MIPKLTTPGQVTAASWIHWGLALLVSALVLVVPLLKGDALTAMGVVIAVGNLATNALARILPNSDQGDGGADTEDPKPPAVP